MNASLTDGVNLLSKLNNRRLWNFTKLVAGYFASKLSGRTILLGNPSSLSVEPTTSCNLRCPQCPSGLREFSRNTGMLGIDLYKKIIDETHHELIWLVLYFQGEPFLNKQFLEFVRYASQKKIYTATS
ncbi:MAG: radical SAM protein, partial [Bacteroidota bacterium]